MDEKTSDFEDKSANSEKETTSIVRTGDMTLDENQLSDQLYYNAGLDPIVDAGIKDYDKKIQQENKLINKVFGIRESDIKGYGESVAKRVAFAVYSLLNKQYGGKVGDMRSYIMSLEDDRDRANVRYDDLMGRVIGILGDEYKELRTDSKEFIEKLTKTLGDDLKDTKIDQTALAERLADIDGLRSQISNLNKEKELLIEKHEAQTADQKSEHKAEISNLKAQIDTLFRERGQLEEKHESQITDLNSRITGLESDKNTLRKDLEQLKKDYDEFRTAVTKLSEDTPSEEMVKKMGEDMYRFILKDSKVPGAVLKGIGQFIDLNKYLELAAQNGAKEVRTRIENTLGKTRQEL